MLNYLCFRKKEKQVAKARKKAKGTSTRRRATRRRATRGRRRATRGRRTRTGDNDHQISPDFISQVLVTSATTVVVFRSIMDRNATHY